MNKNNLFFRQLLTLTSILFGCYATSVIAVGPPSSPLPPPASSPFSSASPHLSSPVNSALPTSTTSGASPETTSPTPNSFPSEKTKTDSPATPRHSYSSVHVSGPYIAMTFDDGPDPSLTPKLLDMLKERGIKATFFVIGKNVASHPNIVKRMHEEGHEIANHSWSHPALNKCNPDKFKHEITATNEAIQSAIGVRPTLVRPPYGATNSNLNRTMDEKYGLKVILWSVDPMDWKYRNSERVTNYILSHTKPGDIILAHDIHATTITAMPKILDQLLARGLKFVTVSQLFTLQTPPTPSAQSTGTKTTTDAASSLSPSPIPTISTNASESSEAPSLNPSATPPIE